MKRWLIVAGVDGGLFVCRNSDVDECRSILVKCSGYCIGETASDIHSDTTTTSKRAVFWRIAEHSNHHWPYYRLPNTDYTATDLGALEHDFHRLASVWFRHDAYEDVEAFIC